MAKEAGEYSVVLKMESCVVLPGRRDPTIYKRERVLYSGLAWKDALAVARREVKPLSSAWRLCLVDGQGRTVEEMHGQEEKPAKKVDRVKPQKPFYDFPDYQ